MLLGCIADDFTGATDLANTLAKGMMATIQFVGTPAGQRPDDCEAGVVALKTRSIPPAEAVSQSLAAARLAEGAGLPPVSVQILLDLRFLAGRQHRSRRRRRCSRPWVLPSPIVCPVFPATGRTLYMGHLFVRIACSRIRHGEASADADDRSGHPSLALAADAPPDRALALYRRAPGGGGDSKGTRSGGARRASSHRHRCNRRRGPSHDRRGARWGYAGDRGFGYRRRAASKLSRERSAFRRRGQIAGDHRPGLRSFRFLLFGFARTGHGLRGHPPQARHRT